MVNAAGELLSAAFGLCPVDRCPGQTAREAEDFALFMAAQLTMGEVEVYLDCAGTLQTAHAGPAVATAARTPRSHLWCAIFARWDSGTLEQVLHKTKAHVSLAAVERG